MKLLVGFCLGVILSTALFNYYVAPNWKAKQKQQTEKIVMLYSAIGEAEKMMNGNLQACTDTLIDWKTRYNALCTKWRISKCTVSTDTFTSKFQFIDDKWNIEMGTNAYSPI